MIIKAKQLEIVLNSIKECVLKEDVQDVYIDGIFKNTNKGIPKKIITELYRLTTFLSNPVILNRLGKFIVVTGIDKSGKETHTFNPKMIPNIISIYEYLKLRNYNVLKIALPSYDTIAGSLISSYLGIKNNKIKIVGEISKDCAWILWALDRAQYNPIIKKWLSSNNNNIVLSKRWTETNIAYQIPLGVKKDNLLNLEKNIIKQDYTVVIDVDIKEIMKRIYNSDETADKYEKSNFLTKVNKIYDEIENYYPFGKIYHVNGSQSIEITNKKLLNLLSTIIL